MTKELYIESGDHWINAPYPLKPNDTEVKMYQQHLLTGTTLLLGSTVPLLPLCHRFICRVFSRKFSYMKYATFFYKDFHNATKIAEINESCPIFIWKFTS